ncbi:MAG: hypothetical protein ABEK36_01720 [Candidatus Aenigmatarchaeota archaeon]
MKDNEYTFLDRIKNYGKIATVGAGLLAGTVFSGQNEDMVAQNQPPKVNNNPKKMKQVNSNMEYVSHGDQEKNHIEGREINLKETLDEPEFDNIDVLHINELGDDDDKVEMAVADNYEGGTRIVLWPYEIDGEDLDKVYSFINEKTMEIDSGDVDGDGTLETVVYTNRGVYKFNREGNMMKVEGFPAYGQITDGQIVSGDITASFHEEMGEGKFGIYEPSEDGWKPFKGEKLDMKEFVEENFTKSKEYYNPGEIIPGPIAHFAVSDNEDTLLYTVDKEDAPRLGTNGPKLGRYIFHWPGKGTSKGVEIYPKDSKALDLDYANIKPWEWDEKKFLMEMEDENGKSLRFYDPEEAFNLVVSNYDCKEWSEKDATDIENLNHMYMLPKEAENKEGSMDWYNEFWKPRYGKNRPLAVSTKDGRLLMDNDRDLRTPDTYNLDFNYNNFSKWLIESKKVEID